MKRIIYIITTLMIIISLAGCKSNKDVINNASLQDILPVDASASKSVTATLFYRYKDDNMLAGELRTINVTTDKKIEAAIIEELLKGPDTENTELNRIINRNVKLLNVTDNRDTITLTFSKELLEVSDDIPDNWMNNSTLKVQVNDSRRLMVYSIVNTVTEYANYSKVQILVEVNGNGSYTRVKRSDLGFVNDNLSDNPLGVLSRNIDYILTPDKVAFMFFKNFTNRDWQSAYKYILDIENNKKKPANNEFDVVANYNDITIVDSKFSNSNVSDDGKTAIVSITYTIRTKNGDIQMTDIPLKLIKENGCWKIPYSFISNKLFTTANS